MLNRIKSKIVEVQAHFPKEFSIEILESAAFLASSDPVSVVVNTFPVDKPLNQTLLSSIEIEGASSTVCTPTLLEAAHKPKVTPVMQLDFTNYGWSVVPGCDMLVDQGVEQFKKFVGIVPPYGKVYDAVTNYFIDSV